MARMARSVKWKRFVESGFEVSAADTLTGVWPFLVVLKFYLGRYNRVKSRLMLINRRGTFYHKLLKINTY